MTRASLCATLSFVLAAPALAGDPTIFGLQDRGASAIVNLSGPAAGMNFLSTDGQISRLRLQGFWFRTGSMENEANISSLPLTGFFASDTNPIVDNRVDTLAAQFTGQGFTIEPTWKLRGGAPGSGRADVVELISINNTGRAPLAISFFQYSNFVLSVGAGPFDTATIQGNLNNTADQQGNAGYLSETVVTPSPTRYSAGDAGSLLSQLNDGSTTNLDNVSSFGPGLAAWAFQWDFVIQPGQSVLISKTKQLIPTPGATALLGVGALLAMRRRR